MNTYKFSITLTVTALDVNHRNHVSFHNFFAYFHKARTAYLEKFGYEENSTFKYGLIVAESNCQYKRELSEGDTLRVYCRVAEMTSKMVRMVFQIMRGDVLCAEGGITYLCYSYDLKKVIAMPKTLMDGIMAFEGTR